MLLKFLDRIGRRGGGRSALRLGDFVRLRRWVGLVLIALVEGVWLAIRIEAPSTGFLSYPKGFPSIFVTSRALVMLLGWVGARARLLLFPTFQNFPHNPWPIT
jgi:hypothetical protein